MKFEAPKIASALKDVLKEGYGLPDFYKDLQAGFVVAIVAIPLSMALAIASGAAPQNGLYGVIVAGFIVALLGGSRFQVTGPTAAFVVLLLPMVQKFGLSGLFVAGLLSGIFLIIFALLKLGDVIQYVPHPVTTGFTSGIALIIAVLQIKDFFGITLMYQPTNFIERIIEILKNLHSISWGDSFIGITSVIIMLVSVKKIKKVPAPIIGVIYSSIAALLLSKIFDGFNISTINSRFNFELDGVILNGVPQKLPSFILPWQYSAPDQPAYDLTFQHIREIIPSALSLALLGAIATLLSAVVADGATQKKHNSNSELLAMGIGNIITPFFGGIPVSGAIARTTTNIRSGARSPISAAAHAFFTLIVLVALAPLMGYIPMAALASILLIVAWNMSEKRNFINIMMTASKDDKLVLLACFFFTVFIDMTIGVAVGMVLASLLFVRRVSKLTETKLIGSEVIKDELKLMNVPKDVFVYKIVGSLFFGAAQRAISTIGSIPNSIRVVIFDLSQVDLMDSTGMVALDTSIKSILASGKKVYLSVPNQDLRTQLMKFEHSVNAKEHRIVFFADIRRAVEVSAESNS